VCIERLELICYGLLYWLLPTLRFCCSFLLFPGARAETGARVSGAQGYQNEGMRGLKALGVRDLNYRMAYLACTVQASNARVS